MHDQFVMRSEFALVMAMRICTVIILVAASNSVGQPTANVVEVLGDSSPLPPSVQHVKSLIQGKEREEVRKIIIQQLGPANRDVGSGIHIWQWDVAGGVLTFNQTAGPTFEAKGQSKIHLIATHNPIKENLVGSYELFTLATDDPKFTSCWLGDLEIETNLSYSYVDSRQFPAKSARQTNNFFYLHPVGSVEIQYPRGVTDQFLLEAMPTGTVVAWLHFRSGAGDAHATFSITSHEPSRRLEFGSSLPISFKMEKGWKELWR
jgi:hypothetical protein